MRAIALLFCLAGGAIAAEPPGQMVDVGGGHRVHLYCTGAGSPTVVVTAGAFSFDWGLIQPEVARFTRICTYDPSGSVWSDPPPRNTVPKCSDRVSELHTLLNSAKIEPPYVLVGYSIGGPYARLYAQTFRRDVAGMVIVDHAFLDTGVAAALRKRRSPARVRTRLRC